MRCVFYWDRLDDLSACDCNILQLCRIAQKQNMYQQVEQVWNTDTSPLILLRPILWIEFVLTPHLCEWTILKILKHSTSNKKNIKRVCVCIYTYIILNSIKFRHYIIYIYIIYIHDNSILQWFTQSLATPSPTPRLGIQSVAAVFGQGTSCALWLSRKGAGAPVDGPVVSRLDVWVRTRYIIYIYILCIYIQCIKIYIEVFVYYTCDIYMW